jgi:tetratricopeptide (TPR) repeat protein
VSPWNPPITWVAVAGLLGLVGTGMGLLRKRPLAAFGILFCVVSLLPESLLIPTYLFFGYRAILPMAGVLLVLADVLFGLRAWSGARISPRTAGWIAPAILAIPMISMATMTYSQAARWSPYSFWHDAFSELPVSAKNVEPSSYLDIVTGYGGELLASGKYNEAIEILRLGEHMEPDQTGTRGPVKKVIAKKGSVFISLGLAYKKLGNFPEAVTYYRKALEIDPRSPIALSNLGNVLEASGDTASAVQYYRKALELAPEMPQSQFNIGCILLKQGKWAEAISSFQKAVAGKPDFAEAYANMGVALLNEGRPEEAAASLEKALNKLTDNAELYNAFGAALAQTGRTAEAIRSFRKALALQPDHSGARQNLELLLRETGSR